MHQFGDGGQDGHLPKHGAPQQAGHLDVEMAFLVLAHLDLGGFQMEASQEGEEPQREIVAFPLHESHFLVGDFDVAVEVKLFAQLLGEAFRIDRVVAVDEGVLPDGARELLKVSVAHAEGVEWGESGLELPSILMPLLSILPPSAFIEAIFISFPSPILTVEYVLTPFS